MLRIPVTVVAIIGVVTCGRFCFVVVLLQQVLSCCFGPIGGGVVIVIGGSVDFD